MAESRLKNFLKFIKTHEVILTIFIGFILVVGLFLILISKNWSGPVSSPRVIQQSDSLISLADDGITISPFSQEYIVQPGDSSWKLAAKFLNDAERYVEIEQANNLIHNQQLQVGQKLIMPQLDSLSSSPSLGLNIKTTDSTVTYEVKTGDCLWSIAQSQLNSGYQWVDLYRANQTIIGKNPDLIYPHTILVLPKQ